jgi:hypothetical protein
LHAVIKNANAELDDLEVEDLEEEKKEDGVE